MHPSPAHRLRLLDPSPGLSVMKRRRSSVGEAALWSGHCRVLVPSNKAFRVMAAGHVICSVPRVLVKRGLAFHVRGSRYSLLAIRDSHCGIPQRLRSTGYVETAVGKFAQDHAVLTL